MKTRTLYAIVFILAIVIILTLIYTRSKVSELNPPLSERIQVEVEQPVVITESAEPVFFHKAAITIIKPGQGKQIVVSELDKTKDIKDQQDSSISSQKPSAAGGVNSKNTEEAAGVTRLGKYPTKEETKEMNSKGIVMY